MRELPILAALALFLLFPSAAAVCVGESACVPGQEKVCGSDIGKCVSGIRMCTAECGWSECIDTVDPLPNEVCENTIDDDCDSQVDESGCVMPSNKLCADGEISSACLCERDTYTIGYCMNNYYFQQDPRKPFPWELLSLLGGMIITITLMSLVVYEVVKFKRLNEPISPTDNKKAIKMRDKARKTEMAMERMAKHVRDDAEAVHAQEKAALPESRATQQSSPRISEMFSNPGVYMGQKVTVYGYIKMSKYVSEQEMWYTLCDETGVIPLLVKGKIIGSESASFTAVLKKTVLDRLYLEIS